MMGARGDYDRVGPEAPVPRGYKVWVFGSKLAGVAVFTVGIEMVTRGELLWAVALLITGAAIVIAPVRGPRAWRRE